MALPQEPKRFLLENIHAVPDESGGFTFWGKDGIIK